LYKPRRYKIEKIINVYVANPTSAWRICNFVLEPIGGIFDYFNNFDEFLNKLKKEK
jgi:hypothetical protein